MARPEIHEDLPDYEQAGHTVFTVDSDWLTRYPEVGGHLLAAIREAKAAGLTTTTDATRTTVVKPKSEAELNAALRRAQEMWDSNEKRYNEALADPSVVVADVWRRIVNDWARSNDRPEVDFESAAVTS